MQPVRELLIGWDSKLMVLGECLAGSGKEVRRDHFVGGKSGASLSLLYFRGWYKMQPIRELLRG